MAAADGDESSKPSTRRQKKQHDISNWRRSSIFEVGQEFFASCRVVPSPVRALPDHDAGSDCAVEELGSRKELLELSYCDGDAKAMQRWSCNTCKGEFESLQEQRLHFKSDLHRFNIKLRIAGKSIIKEEDFDESISDSLCKDYDVSSISGSEDEEEREARSPVDKNKIYIQLQNREIVCVWRCLLLNDFESIQFGDERPEPLEGSSLTPRQVLEKMNCILREPHDRTCLRIVLLAKGGHFAGCVFDGDSQVAHKTFHRYVVRAKSGKKQSSKDAGGRAIHSAGASLRRYNELSLKKDIRELLESWALYFAAASCVFIHSPSTNRQLLFDGEKPYFACHPHAIRHIPLPVRRPTLKEAKRLYTLLVQISPEKVEEMSVEIPTQHEKQEELPIETELSEHLEPPKVSDVNSISTGIKEISLSIVKDEIEAVNMSTQLHEAAKSGNAKQVLELLELGLDPCIKDERGQTPYMLASEKEVRNTFRRFMASNLEKWDWQAAKVPSALTKEMEESQAVKQAEKDAKRKAKAKELKKLKKAKEKSQRTEASKNENHDAPVSSSKRSSQTCSSSTASKEVELKRIQDGEREKRAAAAERRIAKAAAFKTQGTQTVEVPGSLGAGDMIICSCCSASLAGKVPFHRYNYKYCSSSCMHSHREILDEDS